jgi:hypothetical protein
MTSTKVIPPIKEHLNVKPTYPAIPINTNTEIKGITKFDNQADFQKHTEASRQNSGGDQQIQQMTLNRPPPYINNNTPTNHQRSHSQTTIQNYTKTIDYLKDQYKQTLDKLHTEVAQLKSENKKLNFKILVENEGGSENIIREQLNLSNRNSKTDYTNVKNDILLNETIKELKVKLKITEDSNQHLSSTVKNLNKKMNLLKKLSGQGYKVSSNHSNQSSITLSQDRSSKNLYMPTPPTASTHTIKLNSISGNAPVSSVSSTFRQNSVRNISNKNITSPRNLTNMQNQYNEILENKEKIITDLKNKNEFQNSKMEEMYEIIKHLENQVRNLENNQAYLQLAPSRSQIPIRHISNNRRKMSGALSSSGKNSSSNSSPCRKDSSDTSCVLRSTASKVRLAPRNQMTGSAGCDQHIAIHTSTSGTTTILPPLNRTNTNIINNHQDFDIQVDNIYSNAEQVEHNNKNGMPISTRSRIEINKINQQRLEKGDEN